MPDAAYMNVPFEEAIERLLKKLNVPTSRWQDLWEAEHNTAFTVAGAARNDLLADIRAAVQKGLSDGTSLQAFRKEFSSIVERYGWTNLKGGVGWRAGVIFNTNMMTSYAAGRYQQQMDPAVRSVRPYLRYVPSSSRNPRAEHAQWYNLVLPADDPFWNTHYPPNGWGCKCGVVSVSGRELAALQERFAGTDYEIRTEAPEIVTYEYVKPDGEIIQVPQGIDPGWAYNPGQRDAAPNVASNRGGICAGCGGRTPDIAWEYWLQFRRAA